jgi:hypothetical protein
MPINQPIVMTYSNKTNTKLTDTEYDEMVALKKAINEYPQAVVPEKLEEFAEYLVRSLKELGN